MDLITLKETIKVLKDCEWVQDERGISSHCPICDNEAYKGHLEDCSHKLLLDKLRKELKNNGN